MGRGLSIEGSRIMSFCYNVDEMPYELNSCFYYLASLYVVLLIVSVPINDIK